MNKIREQNAASIAHPCADEAKSTIQVDLRFVLLFSPCVTKTHLKSINDIQPYEQFQILKGRSAKLVKHPCLQKYRSPRINTMWTKTCL